MHVCVQAKSVAANRRMWLYMKWDASGQQTIITIIDDHIGNGNEEAHIKHARYAQKPACTQIHMRACMYATHTCLDNNKSRR